MLVESGGDVDAIGDGGDAVGCLQIHMCVIVDVNRVYGTNFTSQDRYDKFKSFTIAELYLTHYASVKRLGHEPTLEEYARMWNGGPNGHKKDSTIKYWQKVQKTIKNHGDLRQMF